MQPGADARPRPGTLDSGKQGASRPAPCGAVDWVQTLQQGRPRQRKDLAFKTRRGTAPQLWLVIVDASASTRRHHALTDAKGLLAEVFEDAYRQRARVAVMTASGLNPQWHVSGIKAAKGLEQWLEGLGAGAVRRCWKRWAKPVNGSTPGGGAFRWRSNACCCSLTVGSRHGARHTHLNALVCWSTWNVDRFVWVGPDKSPAICTSNTGIWMNFKPCS